MNERIKSSGAVNCLHSSYFVLVEYWGWNIGGGILGWNIGGGILGWHIGVEYWGWNIGGGILDVPSTYFVASILRELCSCLFLS